MASAAGTAETPVIRSSIPARIDRLPWSRFHTRMVVALGVAWVLDGLEITIAANVVADLTQKSTLNLTAAQSADIATWYLVGEVIGALFFGRLSDKLGRRNLFMITLGVYLVGSGLTAATVAGGGWVVFLYATRIIAGMGIGGEYAAINSAIDEMIPARYRGRVDIAVNGTYWAGSILGTIATLFLLNHLSADLGWRLAFLLGPVLSLCIIYVRRNLPESPRWQVMHGREQAAETSIAEIERDVEATKGPIPPVDESAAIEIKPTEKIGYLALLRTLFVHYPGRSTLVAALMITQSFLYNAIFFTYGLVLKFFFHVPATSVPYYFFAFAVGNLLGPLTIGALRHAGPEEDDRGHLSPVRGAADHHRHPVQAGHAERDHSDDRVGGDLLLRLRGRGAGYLTASEVFPLEVRAKAIAVFFAIAQFFGLLGTHLYGHLIGTGNDPNKLFVGYLIGAGAMILGGVAEIIFGVAAEGKSLEDIAAPLSMVRKAVGSVDATKSPPPLRGQAT